VFFTLSITFGMNSRDDLRRNQQQGSLTQIDLVDHVRLQLQPDPLAHLWTSEVTRVSMYTAQRGGCDAWQCSEHEI